MKRPRTARFLALLLALVLSVSLCVPALASGNWTELTEPESGYTTSHDYSATPNSPTRFFLYANEKGGLTRVESPISSKQLHVEEYDKSLRFLSGKLIPFDGLEKWGGFYAGTNYNFIITGQDNYSESDSVEIIRVLKYSKDWQYLGRASVYGGEKTKAGRTQMIFRAGDLRCAEAGGILYIHTSHTMYKSSDGKNHQSNMMVQIRENDMTVTGTVNGSYVSHSFNQFIMADSLGNLIIANHGDGYPRAMRLTKLDNMAGKENILPMGGEDTWSYVDTDTFIGLIGANETYANLGGIAETSNGYLMAYRQRASGAIDALYQVKLAYIAKKDFKSVVYATGGEPDAHFQIRQLTDTKADLDNWDPFTAPNQGNPFVVPTGLSGGYIIWKSGSGEISWTNYDANGQTGAIRTGSGKLSDCQPIYFNGKVVWFATENDGANHFPITFYTLDASGLTAIDAASGASTPGTPSTPSPFKDVPDNHWALEYIRTCVEKGVVTGLGDGNFDPDGTVSYAQFVAMITRAFFNDEVQKVTDTAGKPWYYPYMQTAFSYMLDLFSNIRKHGGWPEVVVADDPINRYDMAAIARQTLLRFGTNPSNENPNYNPYENNSIKDYDQFPQPDWYQLYRAEVPVCYYYGILTGMEGGCFHGEENMTRAQACVVLVRMMNLLSDKTRRAKEENPVITIECRDRQTNQVLRYYRHLCNSDSTYLFPPTVIDGYTPEEAGRIKGTASSTNSTVVVYYTPN